MERKDNTHASCNKILQKVIFILENMQFFKIINDKIG